jgi:hypothetical protein
VGLYTAVTMLLLLLLVVDAAAAGVFIESVYQSIQSANSCTPDNIYLYDNL